MPFRLIRKNGPYPPAGYTFTDSRTGRKFDGLDTDFKGQIVRIVEHRFANPQKYPLEKHEFFDAEYVGREIEEFTCLRLGFDKRYCEDSDKPTRRKAELPTNGSPPNCPACGKIMIPRVCSTCGGHKVKGWRCPACYSEIA